MTHRELNRATAIVLLTAIIGWSCSDNSTNTPNNAIRTDADVLDVIPASGQPIQRFARDQLDALRNASTPDLDLPLDGPWVPLNDSNAEFRDGSLAIEANGKPPFVQFPLSVDTHWYQAIEIEMRVSDGTQCQFKWATAAAPDFARNSGVFEPIIADGGFHTYTIELSHYTLAEWSGPLRAIEFWPSNDIAANAEIRRMRLVRGSREAPRRLTLVNQTHEAVFGTQPPWRVRVPSDGQLNIQFGMLQNAAERYGSDGARFSVAVSTADGTTNALFDHTLNPVQETADRGWQFAALALNNFAGQEVNLEFQVDSLSNALGDFAFWGSPVLFERGNQNDAPPVIFISLDTLRADHLSAYGYHRKTSSNIDRLAEDAILFEHAITPEPWTLPSHMTMFTGLYPKNHGVTGNALLPESRLTLGDAVSGAGYLSAGFTGLDWWLMPFRGFAQGFDLYNHARPTSRHIYATMPLAMDWLRQHDTNRFFLFFHAFDIHSKVHSMDSFQLPYETGDPAMVHFAKGMTAPTFARPGLETRATHYLQRGNEGQLEPTQDELEYMIAVYDDCIRMVDIKLGELFDSLRSRGLYDDALIVLLADHGESFFEHDKFLHQTVYEENCHVPLIVKLPGNSHAGKRIANQVVLTDVLPTIIDVLDIESAAEFDGQSLLPAIEDAAAPHPLAYIQREEQRAIRTNGIKRIQYTDGRHEEWYDLQGDPNETEVIANTKSQETAKLFDQAHTAFFTVPSGGWHIALTGDDKVWNSQITFSAESRITKIAFLHGDRRDDTLIQQQGDLGFVANVSLANGGEEECIVAIEHESSASNTGTTNISEEERAALEAMGYGGGETDAVLASGRASIAIVSDTPFYVNGATESVTSFTELLDPALFDSAGQFPSGDDTNVPNVRIWYSPPSSDESPKPLSDVQAARLGRETIVN